MRIEDFLEKKEQVQVALIKKLVLTGGKTSYGNLRKHLSISKASLETYLDEIDDNLLSYTGACQLKKSQGSMLELILMDHFSIETVYIDYVKRSLKFQLIEYVFFYQEYTAVKIGHDLAISESSLFRKIKEVNQLLKEFQIKIKNGRLQGEELQIRYFYFQLYSFVPPNPKFQELIYTSKIQRMIAGLERDLSITISAFSRKRVSLWFAISKKRANVIEKSYKSVKKKMKPYKTDRLFQQVRQLVILYFSRYSIEIIEEESMLHFIFLITQSILSETDFSSYDLIRSRRTPTALADTLLRETVLHYYLPRKPTIMLERQINYYLSQVNGGLYFFEGILEIYERADLIKQDSLFGRQQSQQLAQELLETAMSTFGFKKATNQALQIASQSEYETILTLVEFKISKEIRVGIDLKLTEMHREILTKMLIVQMENIPGVTVEPVQIQRKYDLILTNESQLGQESEGTDRYVLSELCSNYDLIQIKNRMEQLKV